MTRLLALAAILLAAPIGLYGCINPPVQQAGADCEKLGLRVRVLDGDLAQERIELGAATRRQDQRASDLRLAENESEGAGAGQTIGDRPGGNLEELRSRLAAHEAALAEARSVAAACPR